MYNRSSFFEQLALMGILAGAGIASAQSVSGVITDKVTGKSLEGALVTRISDSAQTVTDATGHFVIGGGVGIGARRAVAPQLNLIPVFSGGYLHFTAASVQTVLIQRFYLDGRLVSTVFSNSVLPGSYAVNLVAQFKSSAGIYITRLRLNGHDYSFKTAAYDRNSVGSAPGSLLNVAHSPAGSSIAALAKISAVSDSLSVSRFGYKKAWIPLADGNISVALDTANLFVGVEGGTFTQGTNDTSRAINQRPAHQVTLSSFLINKYSTTFDDFDAFAVANKRAKPSSKSWGRGTTPVINVSFYDIVLFANWQSQKDGLTPVYTIDSLTADTNNVDTSDHRRWTVTPDWSVNGYRLLTESEYEYATRGGKLSHGYLFSGSDTLAKVAWTGYDTLPNGTLLGIQPVGQKQPNELGIFDLSGNTGTLTWDKALSVTVPAGATPSTATYTADDVTDPKGIDGKYNRRVKRGSGPMSDESCNVVTARFFKKAGLGAQCFGVRLARSK
jgi:formylglycine-generating enzyme required for sulfatase activity